MLSGSCCPACGKGAVTVGGCSGSVAVVRAGVRVFRAVAVRRRCGRGCRRRSGLRWRWWWWWWWHLCRHHCQGVAGGGRRARAARERLRSRRVHPLVQVCLGPRSRCTELYCEALVCLGVVSSVPRGVGLFCVSPPLTFVSVGPPTVTGQAHKGCWGWSGGASVMHGSGSGCVVS